VLHQGGRGRPQQLGGNDDYLDALPVQRRYLANELPYPFEVKLIGSAREEVCPELGNDPPIASVHAHRVYQAAKP
jgi:hypothetical protein